MHRVDPERFPRTARKAYYVGLEDHRRMDALVVAGFATPVIYHSHPDCDAYFSETDLKNSCPWYSFVVLSIRGGEFDHANSFLPDADQTRADAELLSFPGREIQVNG